jgi:hypothetical protein
VIPDGKPVDQLPNDLLRDDVPRYTGTIPVVFGLYWRSGKLTLEGPTTVCADYSAGNGGPLVAYRWDGEPRLSVAKLVSC